MLRRRRQVVGVLATGVTLALLTVGGYTAAVALTPLPELTPTLTVDTTQHVTVDPGSAAAVVAAQSLPTAIGWADGEEVWSNDETAYPLASVSKLITVLVCMEEQPLEPGADGPTYTWTAADRARQDEYLAVNGVAYPIPVGTEITLRQMLQFIFLPSSNDYAAAYAYWTFGDNDTFLAAVEKFKQKHGLTSVNFVEPTGMNEENRANAADLVRVARIAIENPTVREFNGMRSAVMPWGVGLIENTNPLLGEVPGVIGVKTGALGAVGYNFVLAQQVDAFGREVTHISVTLARPTKEARAQSGRDMLAALAPLPQQVPLLSANTAIGTVRTWQGEAVQLVTTADAAAVLVPGESATVELTLNPIEPAAAGVTVGEWIVDTPTGEQRIPVATTTEIVQPDLWWRLANPGMVFGWDDPPAAE